MFVMKHQIGFTGDSVASMPTNAKVRAVVLSASGTTLDLWCEEDASPVIERHFATYRDGHPFETPVANLRYVGFVIVAARCWTTYEIVSGPQVP